MNYTVLKAKIACFFGLHDWDYRYQRSRHCRRCGTVQVRAVTGTDELFERWETLS